MSDQVDLENLASKIQERLLKPLPGSLAHEPMRATPIGIIRPEFTHKVPAKKGSVLIVLFPSHNTIKIPLTIRADYVGAHSGQISLPGGKREPDEDDIANALRESEEEIGLDRNQVQVLGRLTDFFVIPSNFIVTPIIGICKSKPLLKADHFEVAKILECDLFDLIADDAIHQKEILAAKKFQMLAPHFVVEGEVVWGATAMMLNEFRWVVRDALGKGR